MSHVNKFVKLFTYTCVVSIIFFLISISIDLINYASDLNGNVIHIDNIKYILLWTNRTVDPLNLLQQEKFAFIDNKCEFTNCYVTDKRDFLKDITLFDAIVFNGRNIYNENKNKLPKTRSSTQKYVYSILEASRNYPVCQEHFDNFFNWTWTYRLDSDVTWTYFNVYNNAGEVVAPRETVNWIKTDDENYEISDKLKEKIQNKTKAAAWFVSHCKTKSRREIFVADLRRSLSEYNLDVDIYGGCGEFKCPRESTKACNERLSKEYYFYLSFENALVKDYVTEKVLTALNHDTVPIVFGGANYTRFLPPGSYINAMELSPMQLAKIMHQIITDKNKQSYYNFFKWRKYYHFKDSLRSKVCDICALMNSYEKVNVKSLYKDFRNWWNPKRKKVC